MHELFRIAFKASQPKRRNSNELIKNERGKSDREMYFYTSISNLTAFNSALHISDDIKG